MAADARVMNDRIDKARDLLEEGLPEEALAELEAVEERTLGPDEQRERFYLTSAACLELGETETARVHLERALSLGEDAGLRCLEARILLAAGERERALRAAEQAVRLDPREPAGQHIRGIVLTFCGRLKDADGAFAAAAELDPATYFQPYRLRRKDFDEAVDKVLASLPEAFRRYLENVEIAVEDVPSSDLLEDEASHDLLGLYQGRTVHTGGWDFPDRVLLFQRNIENVSPNRETLLREIRDTLLHEVGHHFGLDEEQLQVIEDSWDKD